MAECTGCTGTCSGGCSGSCDGGCTDSCSGCGGACSNSCTGCSGTCRGTCTCCNGCSGTCTSSCSNSCYSSCEGNCYTTCNTSCYTACTGQCKGYCSNICQTYCETKQTFTENKIGKPVFSWTNTVSAGSETELPSTIQITAKEWNILKSYIKAATSYCGGTAPSGPDASNDPNSEHNLISAAKYNDLANGLGVTNVVANTTLISAENIDRLRTTYNSRQITNTLPAGKYTGGQGECCQSNQVCMASGELLSHQVKTEKCANQTPTTCGDQTSI